MDRVRRLPAVVVTVGGDRHEETDAIGGAGAVGDVAHDVDDDVRRVRREHTDRAAGAEWHDRKSCCGFAGGVVDVGGLAGRAAGGQPLHEPRPHRLGGGEVDDQRGHSRGGYAGVGRHVDAHGLAGGRLVGAPSGGHRPRLRRACVEDTTRVDGHEPSCGRCGRIRRRREETHRVDDDVAAGRDEDRDRALGDRHDGEVRPDL